MPNFAQIATSVNFKLKIDQARHFGASTEKDIDSKHNLKDQLVSSPALLLIYVEGLCTVNQHLLRELTKKCTTIRTAEEYDLKIRYCTRSLTKAEQTYDTT